MTVRALTGGDLADAIRETLPSAVVGQDDTAVWVHPGEIAAVAGFLKESPALDFQFLNSISAVDYIEHFELVYHLTSLRQQTTGLIQGAGIGAGEPLGAVGVPPLAGRRLPGTGDMGPDGDLLRGPPQHEANHAVGGI